MRLHRALQFPRFPHPQSRHERQHPYARALPAVLPNPSRYVAASCSETPAAATSTLSTFSNSRRSIGGGAAAWSSSSSSSSNAECSGSVGAVQYSAAVSRSGFCANRARKTAGRLPAKSGGYSDGEAACARSRLTASSATSTSAAIPAGREAAPSRAVCASERIPAGTSWRSRAARARWIPAVWTPSAVLSTTKSAAFRSASFATASTIAFCRSRGTNPPAATTA